MTIQVMHVRVNKLELVDVVGGDLVVQLPLKKFRIEVTTLFSDGCTTFGNVGMSIPVDIGKLEENCNVPRGLRLKIFQPDTKCSGKVILTKLLNVDVAEPSKQTEIVKTFGDNALKIEYEILDVNQNIFKRSNIIPLATLLENVQDGAIGRFSEFYKLAGGAAEMPFSNVGRDFGINKVCDLTGMQQFNKNMAEKSPLLNHQMTMTLARALDLCVALPKQQQNLAACIDFVLKLRATDQKYTSDEGESYHIGFQSLNVDKEGNVTGKMKIRDCGPVANDVWNAEGAVTRLFALPANASTAQKATLAIAREEMAVNGDCEDDALAICAITHLMSVTSKNEIEIQLKALGCDSKSRKLFNKQFDVQLQKTIGKKYSVAVGLAGRPSMDKDAKTHESNVVGSYDSVAETWRNEELGGHAFVVCQNTNNEAQVLYQDERLALTKTNKREIVEGTGWSLTACSKKNTDIVSENRDQSRLADTVSENLGLRESQKPIRSKDSFYALLCQDGTRSHITTKCKQLSENKVCIRESVLGQIPHKLVCSKDNEDGVNLSVSIEHLTLDESDDLQCLARGIKLANSGNEPNLKLPARPQITSNMSNVDRPLGEYLMCLCTLSKDMSATENKLKEMLTKREIVGYMPIQKMYSTFPDKVLVILKHSK